jgi:predicted O-linked N-acetylglucosamine transferase (SPINDLY family)
MAQQQKCAELYVKDKCPPSVIGLWNGETYAHERIRIAYVSADFREHPLSYLMAGVFEKHDRARFETYGIGLLAEDGSATGRRVKAAFDHFIDVSGQSDRDAAHRLHDAEIDIAIDLMGFTQHCRSNIFARRVAPVQVNYLGYPATMRADYMDYIIGDAFVIPPQGRPLYSEKVVYLPDCFQANDDKRFMGRETPPRSAYGLPENGFVYCSFNNSYKITPAIFDIWMRLLKAVPGSVLWLLGTQTVQTHLRSETNDRGIDPSRLVFAGMVKYEEHLARLRCADLFLDTLPFNAGTTASDVLWAGVPLLTCAGDVFAARMAGSLLMSLGLPELIAGNLDEYEKLAVALATQPQRLSAIKDRLARSRDTAAVFNTERFTRHLEQAYIAMWEKSQAGEAPDDIVVQA